MAGDFRWPVWQVARTITHMCCCCWWWWWWCGKKRPHHCPPWATRHHPAFEVTSSGLFPPFCMLHAACCWVAASCLLLPGEPCCGSASTCAAVNNRDRNRNGQGEPTGQVAKWLLALTETQTDCSRTWKLGQYIHQSAGHLARSPELCGTQPRAELETPELTNHSGV